MHRFAVALAITCLPAIACAATSTNAPPPLKAVPIKAADPAKPATASDDINNAALPVPCPPPIPADFLKGVPLSYEITEIGLTLKLPPQWTALPATSIEVMNNLARTKMPGAKFTYVAGYERDNSMSQPTETSYPTYILIQKTPFENGMTPQKVLEMFPTALKPAIVKTGTAPDPNRWGETWLNESIPAIVVNGAAPVTTALNATVTIVRAYEIVTDQNLIGVNVYCRSDNGKLIYDEIEHILSTMILSDEARPPGNWVEEIKKLNNVPPPRTQTATVPAPTPPTTAATQPASTSPAAPPKPVTTVVVPPPTPTKPTAPVASTPATPPPKLITPVKSPAPVTTTQNLSLPANVPPPPKPTLPLPTTTNVTLAPNKASPAPAPALPPAPPPTTLTAPPLTMQTTPAAILSAAHAPPPSPTTDPDDQPMPCYPTSLPLPAIFHPAPTSPH